MRWIACLLIVAACGVAAMAWSLDHHLTRRQEALLDEMSGLQQQRAAIVAPREKHLQAFQEVTAAAVSNQEPAAAAFLAGATDAETTRLADDVQTSEEQWGRDQAEFAAIADDRIGEAQTLAGFAIALTLVAAFLVWASLPRIPRAQLSGQGTISPARE